MGDYRPMRSGSTDAGPPRSKAAAPDPFYVVKEKVQLLVASMRKDFERWKDVLENTNTSENGDFAILTKELKVALHTIRVDLTDLQQTITIVESKRSRFKAIDDDELDSRRKFCNEINQLHQSVEAEMNSPRVEKKVEKDKRAQQSFSGGRQDRLAREFTRERTDFIEGKRQEQDVLERQQDVVLDDMSAALSRLGDVSSAINVELTEQGEMLGEFSNEMDEAEDNMNVVMAKMSKLLGTKDKGKLCCIFGLFAVVVLLLALVFYT